MNKYLKELGMNKGKHTDPFILFAILSVLSSGLIATTIYAHCNGYALSNIYPRLESTISISLFGIFIPLAFAAITYCKTKLSQTAPEIFSELAINNKIGLAVGVLGILFLTSLATPLMEMENTWYGFLQLCLILCSFALSGSFIWAMFKTAKYSNMLKVFGQTIRSKLKAQILQSSNKGDHNSSNQVAHIIENFIGLVNIHIKRGSREDLEATLNEFQLYTHCFFENIFNSLAEISFSATNCSQQKMYECIKRDNNLKELHKKISDLLFVETSKLIHGVSNVKQEKYLENFAPFLKSTLPCILAIDTGYHSGQWSGFINETVCRTAVLKHTTYPNGAIDLYKELIDADFRNNASLAVYGLSSRLHGLLKILALLKSKEVSFKMWYSGLQSRVINLMLSMLPLCTKYGCDRRIIQKWVGSILEIVPEVYSEDANPLMDGSPVLGIIQTLSPKSLPFVYQQAADNIFLTDYDGQIKLRQLHTLTPVFSIYRALIGKDKDCPRELSQCLVSQFYIDLKICNRIHEGVIDYWVESLSKEYEGIFNELKDHYISKRDRLSIFETEYTLAIPAIALISNNVNQIKLSDAIVNKFADMLINMFNGITPKDANGWERANILLLSAWLKKADRLQEKREELEKILNLYPYSNYSTYMSDYQAYGYPSTSLRKWYLPPSIIWPNDIQKRIDTKLMDFGMLVKYGKQFVAKDNS